MGRRQPRFRHLPAARLSGVAVGVLFVLGCTAAPPADSPAASAPPTVTVPPPSPATAPSQTSAPSPPATPPPIASPAPEAPPSPSPSAEPPIDTPAPPTPSATASVGTGDPARWAEAIRVTDAALSEPSLVVDAEGYAHIAAVRDGAIFHLTNRTGSWTDERLSTPPGTGLQAQADGQPSIALDDDGTLAVAFTRWGPDDTFGRLPDGVYYTNNRSGRWSPPVLLIDDENGAHSPSLELRDGHVHVAYVLGVGLDIVSEDMSLPIRYGSAPEGGAWTDVEISANGTQPVLELAAGGDPHVLFGDDYGLLEADALRLAVGLPDGTFDIEEISGTSRYARPYDLLLDGEAVRMVWSRPGWASSDDRWAAYYQARNGGWGEPQLLMLDGTVRAAALAPDGTVHAVGSNLDGVWYGRGDGGSFDVIQLSDQVELWSDVEVDADGRPHVIFLVGEAGSDELWYVAGPAD